MSAYGTKDAPSAPKAPGCPGFSMRDLLAAGAAANTISTPPDGDDAAEADPGPGAGAGDEPDAAVSH
ncbi:hypothetical protein [Actinacidiphila oryziradicis]|jgi:hypothetical protein|uniref:hypothetical protein n=1 Tax=Actinacidiphila oryziradicis TaxID=2571141 RepID=UPI0023F46313|nr:hypothetical protein [Actinacidiphila oryziradicis]MCW2872356.1 hypothetical protein [Actinacidiphila oryziradicis]